jgi:hypothetical protein
MQVFQTCMHLCTKNLCLPYKSASAAGTITPSFHIIPAEKYLFNNYKVSEELVTFPHKIFKLNYKTSLIVTVTNKPK